MSSLPLHISPLCSPEGKDAVLDQDIKRHGIDTLLVDYDKSLWLFTRSNSLVTNCVLELDNLLESVIDESSFRLDKLLSLLSRRVEESRVDLAKLVSIRDTSRARGTYVFSYSSETLRVRIKAFSTFFGISGCLAPWSMTKPRTSWVSVSVLCCIFMTSIMCRSMGSGGSSRLLIARTASTTSAASFWASWACSLVASEV